MFSKKTYTDKLPLKMNMLTIMSQSEICLLVEAYFLNKFLQMKILRQGYFSKEKRFNTFFINLIYNKGGEEPIKTEPVRQHLQKGFTSSSRAN